MERGSLNTGQSERVIEEAYTPQSPLDGQQPKPLDRPSSTPRLGGNSDSNKPAVSQGVCADGHDVAIGIARSTDSEGDGKLAPAQDATDVRMTEPQDAYADGRVVRPTVAAVETPPESCEDDHCTQAEPYRGIKETDGKGEEKAIGDDATNTLGHNPPFRRNPLTLGQHPREKLLHTVPASHGGPLRKRAIFRTWPRPSSGKPIHQNKNCAGTLSPGRYPWCATLYDIYLVSGIPREVPGAMMIMTGSGLRAAVEEIGELDTAVPEIEWAKSEGKPRVESVPSTVELIKNLDGKARARRYPLPALVSQEKADKTPSPPTVPFVPFRVWSSIPLQEQIPMYLLPQTLFVHDPFCLLTARKKRFNNTSWTTRPDIVRTYNLYLSETGRRKCGDARRKAEELEEFKARTLIIIRYQRTEEQIKKCEPVIEVSIPWYPRRLAEVKESHLYLSPVAKVGEGHHSIVYKGEWELPRDIFMKREICSFCFKESVDKEVQRLKDTGRWEKMLRAGSWCPTGFTGRQSTQAELDDVNDPPKPEMDGENIEREITCVVPPNANPSKIIEMIDQTNAWDELMEQGQARVVLVHFTEINGEDVSTSDSSVPVVRIKPFSHGTQKSCTHQAFRDLEPRTAIFTVVAKLSLEDDPHLDREAVNYQMFPEYFFEHYSGYALISELRTIVPINAIVPQFYGYYVPGTSETETPDELPYISPILLLEHCGKPIKPTGLSDEDQKECMSLLLRFQRAGWLHESVVPRNFLVQQSKPTEPMEVKIYKPELSFRLIDFGRSRECRNAAGERWKEEKVLFEMFGR